MEADFALLRRDVRLTSPPKKAALEMLRRKIEEVWWHSTRCTSVCSPPEQASDRVRNANQARAECVSALTAAEELLEAEEAAKAVLIRDLNSLIFQSSVEQMEALETLQTRMEELSVKAGGIVRGGAPHSAHPHPVAAAAPHEAPGSAEPARAGGAHPDAVTLARAEMAAVVSFPISSLTPELTLHRMQALVQAAEITEARARHVSLHKPPRPPPAPTPALPAASAVAGFTGFA